MYDEDYRDKSEFNMAIHTLGRLNYSLYLCSEHFRTMNLRDLFYEMLNLYMEVSTEMKGDLLKLVTNNKYSENKSNPKVNELDIIEKYILELEPLVERYSRGKTVNGLNKDLYTKLRYMNMLLRKVMKDAGLLMKIKDDARFALG